MRKVLGLISTSIAIATIAGATLAQQSQSTGPGKSGCDSDAGTPSRQSQGQAKIAQGGTARINLVWLQTRNESCHRADS